MYEPYELVCRAWRGLTLRAAPDGGACESGDSYQGALKLTPQADIEASFKIGKTKGGKDVNICLDVSISPILVIPDLLTDLEPTERALPTREPTLLRLRREKVWQ